MAASKEITKTDPAGLPAVYDYSGYEGSGFENQNSEDWKIPFLYLLQSNSPAVEKMENAKAGMLLNTVTNQLFSGKDGIAFVPVSTQHVYVEWRPREAGGGIVLTHQLDSPVVAEVRAKPRAGKIVLNNGNELIETFYVYGLLVTEDGFEHLVLSFKSTAIKHYRSWMTKARMVMFPAGAKKINPPLFAIRYRLTALSEKNTKGSFYNLVAAFDGKSAYEAALDPKGELFSAAKAFLEAIQEGHVSADTSKEEQVSGGPAADGSDIPF